MSKFDKLLLSVNVIAIGLHVAAAVTQETWAGVILWSAITSAWVVILCGNIAKISEKNKKD